MVMIEVGVPRHMIDTTQIPRFSHPPFLIFPYLPTDLGGDGRGGGGGELVHDEGQRRQVVRRVRQARGLRLGRGVVRGGGGDSGWVVIVRRALPRIRTNEAAHVPPLSMSTPQHTTRHDMTLHFPFPSPCPTPHDATPHCNSFHFLFSPWRACTGCPWALPPPAAAPPPGSAGTGPGPSPASQTRGRRLLFEWSID